jgi:hypothetical protein
MFYTPAVRSCIYVGACRILNVLCLCYGIVDLHGSCPEPYKRHLFRFTFSLCLVLL